MARVRYIGADPVTVPELGDRHIEPDEVVEVPDERYGGYVCQPATWEEVEPPAEDEESEAERGQLLPEPAASKAKAVQAKMSAAKSAPQKTED